MTSRWGGLAANVTTPNTMTILHPATGKPIADGAGACAHVDFLSQDSAVGRQHVRDRAAEQLKRAQQSAAGEVVEDPVEEQIALVAALAAGWYLVDPVTSTAIEFPFAGRDSARELFGAPELAWLRRQAWLYVVNAGNFMPPVSPS